MKELFNDNECEAALLFDAFNCINRQAALQNISEIIFFQPSFKILTMP